MATLRKIIQLLADEYGEPPPPLLSEPLELIIWESIGYLVDDEKRFAAFDALKNQVGMRPTDILSASLTQLTSITKLAGVQPERRAHRLQEIAQIVLNDFGGDLSQVLALPRNKAIKAFQQFPSIGEPGAEKVMLFTRTASILALESNGLRVLLRLGFGEEKKNYSASYKSVREALEDQIGSDCDFLIKSHQLLRQHGRTLCKTNNPRCDQCPLAKVCRYLDGALL